MALEKECDELLLWFYNNRGRVIPIEEVEKDSGLTITHLQDVIPILIADGFVERLEKLPSYWLGKYGIAFINRDTYVNRQKRWELENKSKLLEYELKRRTFWIAIVSIGISFLSLMFSLLKHS